MQHDPALDPPPETAGLPTSDVSPPGAGPDADAPTLPGESTPTESPVQPDSPEDTQGDQGDQGDQGGKGEGNGEEAMPALLSSEDQASFRDRWHAIQGRFVDEPRDAVRAADELVSDLMQALSGTFTQHKQSLEEQWKQGEDADTERLRVALRHYRAFFNRLLSG
ncbi:hypothetical protein ADL22_16275 [Streptomyces sp. NRRL F-4489]|uniref:hypothetical protein n=1 Tax=Streptomyces sp. NRRL F-4489 TaxID=1609095 RepID=UPI0007468EEA|nr:hypothetical protein [Streptomyces sp. NRRL F-4489]KUL38826.1 hypothetical protein ADL22_16275 [Streptomyces sp. NRRL F-4489]